MGTGSKPQHMSNLRKNVAGSVPVPFFHARVLLFLVLCVLPMVAAADVPLFEKEPFDRITLDAANDNAVLDVFPLDLPGRKIPEVPKPRDKLKIRLLNTPDKTYEVQWHTIDKVELFEQMILAGASKLVESGDLDEAYDYFLFLRENHAGLDGLEAAMQTYLYEEAKASHMAGLFDRALAMLRELHEMNSKRPGLDKALGMTTDKLVARYVAADDYYSARKLLGDLADWFPKQATVVKWQGQLQSQAAALLSKARKAEQSGDLPAASSFCRELMRVYPELSGARQFAEALWRKYPHVVVGVTLSAVDFQPDHLDDWAARRAGRLLYRTLTEFSGPGSECGTYECPVGNIDVDQISGRITVQLRPDIHWSQGSATLTGHDLSRRLLAMADPARAVYRTDWAELFDALAVRDVYRVDVDLRRLHVRPEALLQTTLVPYTDPALRQHSLLSNGPFVIHSQSETQSQSKTETIYRANRQYFAALPTQPKEICERRYTRGADALRALSRGQIQVVDRVDPWDLDTARGHADLVVEPYAVPSVHCLIPNMRRPLTSKRIFRRALVYAINRGAILRQLVGDDWREGCRQLSGPFPIGTSTTDPIAYAYNEDIEPREYEPRLAVTLATVALRELAAAEAKRGRKLDKLPPLVLAHPADELSRITCGSIAAYLKLVGLEVELRELGSGIPATVPEDVDLMYAQLAMWEPLVDARRLLGEKGPGGGCSPYMSLALQELDAAKEFHPVLWRIHRLAHHDVAVVPLWQMTDHFAYRKSVSAVGRRPVTLYQNVERWQISLEYLQQ